MKKPRKTAAELAELIGAEVALGDARVSIHRDPTGWHVTLDGSSPGHLAEVRQPV